LLLDRLYCHLTIKSQQIDHVWKVCECFN
jgi:hypothetical protein